MQMLNTSNSILINIKPKFLTFVPFVHTYLALRAMYVISSLTSMSKIRYYIQFSTRSPCPGYQIVPPYVL
jgi:hypothetical protein